MTASAELLWVIIIGPAALANPTWTLNRCIRLSAFLSIRDIIHNFVF